MISLLGKADFQFHSRFLAFFILKGAGNLQTRFSRFPCQVVSSEIPPNAGLEKDQAREERRCLYHLLHLDQWKQATISPRSPGNSSNTSGTVGFHVLSASVRVQILSSQKYQQIQKGPKSIASVLRLLSALGTIICPFWPLWILFPLSELPRALLLF